MSIVLQKFDLLVGPPVVLVGEVVFVFALIELIIVNIIEATAMFLRLVVLLFLLVVRGREEQLVQLFGWPLHITLLFNLNYHSHITTNLIHEPAYPSLVAHLHHLRPFVHAQDRFVELDWVGQLEQQSLANVRGGGVELAVIVSYDFAEGRLEVGFL